MQQTASPDPETQHLALLLADLPPGDLGRAAQIMRRRCQAGAGQWLDPATPGQHRPATHMVEISAGGAYATGHDPANAIDNWIAVARRLLAAMTGHSAPNLQESDPHA